MPSAASSHLTRENPYVMNTIQVEVVSAEESIFSGEAEFVVLPGEVGELGVYPNHTPLITRIKAGAVRIRVPGENRDELIFVAGGILEIQPNLVTVLADTAIRGNETLLSKLKFKLPVDELDADMIEDVNIEMSQARETTGIYANILESTIDTYASIISNNMNQTMKTMTSVSIILMFPTLIASIFGMNLLNGMEHWVWGFPLTIIASIIVTFLFVWFFRRIGWI